MKKRFLGLGALGLFVGAASTFYYWSNQPAVTKVATQTNVKGATTPDYTMKPYENDYFTASLPARFSSRTSVAGKGQPLYLQQLHDATADTNLYADQFALTIGTLPAGGIKDISSVQFRSRNAEYEEQSFSWLNSSDGVAFERMQEGYELGVFLQHKDKYITVVMSGLNDKKTQLEHEMQLFVSSIIWK